MSGPIRSCLSHSVEDADNKPLIPIPSLKVLGRLDFDLGHIPLKVNEVTEARFNLLSKACHNLLQLPRYSRSEGQMYSHLNRYPDVLPYDYNRAKLQNGGYHNASPVYLREHLYYLCQAPTVGTLDHFFTFLLENRIKTVVSLAMPQVGRCDKYWDQSFVMNNGTLVRWNTPEVIQRVGDEWIEKREFRIGAHTIDHYQYNGWPDMATCSKVVLRHLINEVSSKGLLIHCSAGVGRSGVFVLSHFGSQNPQAFHLEKSFLLARLQRAGVVQTFAQYQFIDQFVKNC